MRLPEHRWIGEFNLLRRSQTQLVKLWRQWGGLCYWCDEPTFVYPQIYGEKLPGNQATRDHLRDRFNPKRREPMRGPHDIRVVLACQSCNGIRAEKSAAGQPLEVKIRHNLVPKNKIVYPRLPPVIDDPRDRHAG